MKITNPITLDVARSNSYICLLAKQFDSNSRYLEITLADNGQPLTIPADASVVLRATRADGTGAVVSGTVADGKAAVEIDDYILEVNGAVTLSLEISKDGETLTTPSCNLTIQKADANGWIRVYIADSSKAAGNYYITIGGVSYSFTTSQAIPAGGSVYFSSNNATAETRDATGTVIETGLVLTEGTTGTQLVTDVPTMSFLATIAGRVAALESEMPNKADKDGIIALANNLTPYSADSGATQSVPFNNQGTGCGNGESIVDTGSYAQVKKKLGETVCVNQLVNAMTSKAEVNGVTRTANNDGTKLTYHVTTCTSSTNYTAFAFGSYIPGHIYYVTLGNVSLPENTRLNLRAADRATIYVGELNSTSTNIGVYISAGVTNVDFTIELKIIDWSLWYGSTANIPAHLLSHPEDWGRYYSGSLAYNPGQLVNADGSVLTSIGRNMFDRSKETVGKKFNASGQLENNVTFSVSDYIEVSPNTDIYFLNVARAAATYAYAEFDAQKNFVKVVTIGGGSGNTTSGNKTVSSNCHFIRICYESAQTEVCVSLYYPGESGYDQYYPFQVLAEVDTGSEVLIGTRVVADSKAPDGTITRRWYTENLGDIAWTTRETGSVNKVYSGNVTKEYLGYSTIDNMAGRVLAAPIAYNGANNASTLIANVDTVAAGLYTFANAGAAAKTVYLVLPLAADPTDTRTIAYAVATPTTEQGTPFSGASADNFAIDDFGSMYWTQTSGVPQGVEIFYPYDYKAAVDTILNEVNGDVTKLVTAEKVPDAPSSNGTYVLKVTVSDGTPTYSWVAE